MTSRRALAHESRPAIAAWALSLLLLITGTWHFAAPKGFESIVPGFLGSPAFWVRTSGVAELACAMALAWPSTRRRAGWACAALFVVVFPANIKMALDSLDGSGSALVAWLRLPLQIPLIIWALYLARNAERHRATGPAYPAEAGATRSPAPGAEETAGSIGSSRLRS